MVLQTATFAQDMILFIRDYLRSNVTDPLSRSVGFVMTSYPKRDVQYPIITCKITNMSSTKLGISSEVSLMNINIEVRTWARNSAESDLLTQNVINTLRQAQYGTNSTTENEIFGFQLNSTNSVIESTGENTIHSKVMNYVYKAILQ